MKRLTNILLTTVAALSFCASSMAQSFVVVNGYNGAGATSYEGIWNQSAAFNFLAAEATVEVSSSSYDDDSTIVDRAGLDTAGIGAKTVFIEGLDSNFAYVSDTVTLTGTAEVITTEYFYRILSATVLTAGSYAAASGEIYIYNGADTNGVPNTATSIWCRIAAGSNKSTTGAYTVPANKWGVLKAINCWDKDNAIFRVRFRENGTGLWKVLTHFQEPGITFDNTIFPGKTDIILEGANGTTTTPLGGTMLFEVK